MYSLLSDRVLVLLDLVPNPGADVKACAKDDDDDDIDDIPVVSVSPMDRHERSTFPVVANSAMATIKAGERKAFCRIIVSGSCLGLVSVERWW